jgi:3-phenylpropionate/trans-cinnamate dioxygenase ferredoxin subunit
MALKYYPVCEVDAIPPGERLFIEVGKFPITIFNIDGEFYAIADVCTHDDGPLGDGEVDDHQIICPRHGARFDIRTGEVLTLPAVRGVKTYPTRVEDNILQLGLEE